MRLKSVQVLGNGNAARLQWDDGLEARFHAVWLRDVALDPQTHSPGNGQRLITLLEMPRDLSIVQGSIREDGGLSVILAPENKELIFPADWLRERIYDRKKAEECGWLAPFIETWDNGLTANMPVASWPEVESDPVALGDWLFMVRRYGFAILTDIPTASGELCRVAERFGYVRHTNYGRWFEVRSEVNPSNLAFTNAGLQPHTDNPYRDPVPTLQLLSCLENSVQGGESIVVDGFRAAQRLRATSAGAFDLLSGYCARFEFAGQENVLLRSKRPMIELAPDGELIGIRFNNRSAAPFVDIPYDEMEEFYTAYRRFAEIIEEPSMSVKFKLAPGELFIVDNTRVMHARTRFSGSGTRWLQGCYADKDGLLSTLAVIEKTRDQAACKPNIDFASR
jgi:[2-(trimethylamino)ethyl]phosphonate dioxygenase